MQTENLKRGFVKQVMDGARVTYSIGRTKHATILVLFGVGTLAAGLPFMMNWGRDALLAGCVVGMLAFFVFGYFIKETEIALGKSSGQTFVKPKKYKYGRY